MQISILELIVQEKLYCIHCHWEHFQPPTFEKYAQELDMAANTFNTMAITRKVQFKIYNTFLAIQLISGLNITFEKYEDILSHQS